MTLSDILGIAGVVIGVVAIPFSYWIARRGRQRPELNVATAADLVISRDSDLQINGLELTFHNERIDSVTRTLIAIWNRRGDGIRGSDVVPDDPLAIRVGSGRVLQARVVSASRKLIKPEVRPDRVERSYALLTFDFLDEGDGFVVEVLTDSRSPVRVGGTVRGAPIRFSTLRMSSAELNEKSSTRRRRRLFRTFPLIVMALLTIPLCVFSVVELTNSGGSVWPVGVAILAMVALVVAVPRTVYREVKQQVPNGVLRPHDGS